MASSAQTAFEPAEAHGVEDTLYRVLSKFLAIWNYPILNSSGRRAILLATVAAICICRAWIGLGGMQLYCHDAFMMLDGAWRMINGQHPHIDFVTNVGTLAYVPTAVGLWIAHDRAQGFGYGQCIAGFLLALWAYVLSRKRLSQVCAALFCIAVALIAASPSALGASPLRASPAVTYNRYGYALMALLMIEAIAAWRPLRNHDQFWGGISTGALAAISMFLKVTYFAAAIFLLIALLPVRSQTKYRWSGLLAGFAALFIPICAYFGFDLRPMAHDLISLAGARHLWFDYRIDAIFQDALVLCAFAIMTALLLMTEKDREGSRSTGVDGVVVAVAGALLILGNNELSGAPLSAFIAIILIDRVNAYPSRILSSSSIFRASVLVLGSAFVLGSLASGGIAISNGLYRAEWKARHAPQMDSPLLAGFIPVGGDAFYTEFVNDGIGLLNKYRHPGETVMSLDFVNPFSYGLAMPPAPGGTTVLQFGSTFDDIHRQSAEQLFGHADLVMIPKVSSDPGSEGDINRLYGSYLESHFSVVGKSRLWSLYRRNKS